MRAWPAAILRKGDAMEDRHSQGISRREFVGTALAGTGAVVGGLPAAVLAEAGKEKRTPFDRVQLGSTKVRPTRLGIGTGSQGGQVQRDLGKEGFRRLIRHAYDRGIRFFDTADMYRTHELLGDAIKGLPREELVIQTKMRWEPFVPDALKELERFRKEAGVDYFDIVLIHCAQKKNWPADLHKMRDGLSEAKEKGLLRAHGVSCHGLPALREVAGCKWVDVNLARVNHRGHHMDGAEGKWGEEGNLEESLAELKK